MLVFFYLNHIVENFNGKLAVGLEVDLRIFLSILGFSTLSGRCGVGNEGFVDQVGGAGFRSRRSALLACPVALL